MNLLPHQSERRVPLFLRNIRPERVMVLGFMLVVLIGALLLTLPIAANDHRSVGFHNALFTATSAVCVTGLTVVDTADAFSMFGRIVILLLIQIGGLGFMVFATLLMVALGRRISLKNRVLIRESMNANSLAGMVRLSKWFALLALVIELIGACLLSIRFIPMMGVRRGIWHSLFHAVSAFCNAGFDLLGGFRSLGQFQRDPLVLLTVATLVIIGGMGFAVITELLHNNFRFHKLTLHTKLAISKDYEPALLLPIGFGAILANLPPIIDQFGSGAASVLGEDGFLTVLFRAGIQNELFPILIFIAVGAMIDFSPLMKDPSMIFFGAAAQFGIFATFLVAMFLIPVVVPDIAAMAEGADKQSIVLRLASAIGIIGAADGPTTLYVANHFELRDYMAPISVAAYSYMALVPVIQPPVIKALTTQKERTIRMTYSEQRAPRIALILFPIVVTVLAGVIVPMSAPLVGSLMFGNLLRECGVLERLSKTAQNELANLVTILLGLTIGSTMVAGNFLRWDTLLIMGLGLFAFVFDTAGGVLFAKFLNLFRKNKINPMIGAAGISAFPMSARVVQKMAKAEDPYNFILMQSISANVSGQLGSIVAGGLVITLVGMMIGW